MTGYCFLSQRRISSHLIKASENQRNDMSIRAVRIIFFAIVIICFAQSCFVGKLKDFSTEDLKWFQPFTNTDTLIFYSERNEFDTIIFFRTMTEEYPTRNIQSGYYDTRDMEVTYRLTKGSYHKFIKIGKGNINERLVLIENNSSSKFTYTEIGFLGIIFSGKELKNNVIKIDSNTYLFNGRKATYSRINIKEGIVFFILSTDKGILEYTDDRNVKWRRKDGS